MPGGYEWLIIIAVLLLLFGAKKLPEMARSVGQSARVFKGEMKGLKEDEARSKNAPDPKAAPQELPASPPAQTPPAAQQQAPAAGSAQAQGEPAEHAAAPQQDRGTANPS